MERCGVKPRSELLGGGNLPAGMVQAKAEVLVHSLAAPDHYLMRLKAPLIAKRSKPGQFIHIRCAEEAGDTGPLLRRPFSLLDASPKSGTIDFIYKVVGLGTAALTQMPVGATADLLGPLGQPFAIPDGVKASYLLGGGVGIPPMYFLAKWIREGRRAGDRGHGASGEGQVKVFLGARTKKWVICADMFKKLGVEVHIATDDGSLGYKGSVVALLERELLRSSPQAPRLLPRVSRPVLYVCGPTPMMAAAASLARRESIPAQVSLEERMGCAMGVCMGCVVEVAAETTTKHARYQRVCTEGPVFPAEIIQWRTE